MFINYISSLILVYNFQQMNLLLFIIIIIEQKMKI